MIAYLATVHILIKAKLESEAADRLSALLSEDGISEPGSGIIDWSYAGTGRYYLHPVPVQVPESYDPDRDRLTDLADGALQ